MVTTSTLGRLNSPAQPGDRTCHQSNGQLGSPSASAEVIRLQLENALFRILADLPPGTPGIIVSARFGGNAASLRIGSVTDFPTVNNQSDRAGRLTARHREVLEVARLEIARLGRRVLGSEVRAALKAAGVRWGVSTINTTLADLVDAGHLVNDNDKRGYGTATPDEDFPATPTTNPTAQKGDAR